MINISEIILKYTDKNIILALSWGPDSIFLFEMLKDSSLKNKVIACHLNHSLREEADSDEEFVKDLCNQNRIKFESKKVDLKEIIKSSSSISLEEAARKERYEFLRNMKEKHSADYIIVGHHLDDRLETFFLNLARGSKLSGLINMTECSWDIIRPLLSIEKKEILAYLNDNNIKYLTDKTNFDTDITRNKLRLDILPHFENINSSYKSNIKNTINYFEDVKNEIDNIVLDFLEEDYFEIDKFDKKSDLIKKEIIRYIFYISNWRSTIWLSESNINEIIKFVYGKNNKTKKQIKKMALYKGWNKVYFK